MAQKEVYEIGDCLCDMHDGFQYLPKNLEVVSHVRLRTELASELMRKFDIPYSNKDLRIVGWNASYTNLVAAYAYDGRSFGLVELKYV